MAVDASGRAANGDDGEHGADRRCQREEPDRQLRAEVAAERPSRDGERGGGAAEQEDGDDASGPSVDCPAMMSRDDRVH